MSYGPEATIQSKTPLLTSSLLCVLSHDGTAGHQEPRYLLCIQDMLRCHHFPCACLLFSGALPMGQGHWTWGSDKLACHQPTVKSRERSLCWASRSPFSLGCCCCCCCLWFCLLVWMFGLILGTGFLYVALVVQKPTS